MRLVILRPIDIDENFYLNKAFQSSRITLTGNACLPKTQEHMISCT